MSLDLQDGDYINREEEWKLHEIFGLQMLSYD